jgi:hypothetical protein
MPCSDYWEYMLEDFDWTFYFIFVTKDFYMRKRLYINYLFEPWNF